MAEVTKHIGRHIPPNERQQIFTNSDAGAGDIILVKSSLGKVANKMSVDATAAMSFRLNVKQTLVADRLNSDGLVEGGAPNLARSQDVISTENALITVGAGETYDLDDDVSISDIQIVSAAGVYEIVVS